MGFSENGNTGKWTKLEPGMRVEVNWKHPDRRLAGRCGTLLEPGPEGKWWVFLPKIMDTEYRYRFTLPVLGQWWQEPHDIVRVKARKIMLARKDFTYEIPDKY